MSEIRAAPVSSQEDSIPRTSIVPKILEPFCGGRAKKWCFGLNFPSVLCQNLGLDIRTAPLRGRLCSIASSVSCPGTRDAGGFPFDFRVITLFTEVRF